MKRYLTVLVLITLVLAMMVGLWPHESMTSSRPAPASIHRDVDAGAPQPRSSPATTRARSADPGLPYVVLIVLDGARPEYLDVPNIPHVRALIEKGARYPDAWAGILESETPSGHASLGTGSNPRNTGILSFGWVTPENEPISLFDPEKIRTGEMERILSEHRVSSLAGLVHARDPRAKVVSVGGHKYYANDAIGGPDADVVVYYTGTKDGKYVPVAVRGHEPPASILNAPELRAPTTHLPVGVENSMAMDLAIATFKQMRQKVTLINLPEFDWPLGHIDGASRDGATVRTLMSQFDRDLARLQRAYQDAGVLDRTVFVITADHGTAPIDRKVDKSVIAGAVSAAGTRILRDTYHTGAFLWLEDESRAADAAARIAGMLHPDIQAVYFRSLGANGPIYLRASGPDLFRVSGMEEANQHLLSTFNGPTGPDLVVLFREHAAATTEAQRPWKGDHGGTSWESQNMPLVIAGPGVRGGVTSSYPARLIDIAPTVLSLMGIPARGMEGVPLADALTSPTAGSRAAQGEAQKTLEPVVHSLKLESQAERAETR